MNIFRSGLIAALGIAMLSVAQATQINPSSEGIYPTLAPRRTLPALSAVTGSDHLFMLLASGEYASPAQAGDLNAAFALGNGEGDLSRFVDEPVLAVVREFKDTDQSFSKNDVVGVRLVPAGADVLAGRDAGALRQQAQGTSVPDGGTAIGFLVAGIGAICLLHRKRLFPHHTARL